MAHSIVVMSRSSAEETPIPDEWRKASEEPPTFDDSSRVAMMTVRAKCAATGDLTTLRVPKGTPMHKIFEVRTSESKMLSTSSSVVIARRGVREELWLSLSYCYWIFKEYAKARGHEDSQKLLFKVPDDAGAASDRLIDPHALVEVFKAQATSERLTEINCDPNDGQKKELDCICC